jgi:type I restriction enzyme, S subunit
VNEAPWSSARDPDTRLPLSWKLADLGTLVLQSFGGGTPSRKRADYWNGDVPWTTSAHLSPHGGVTIADFLTADGIAHSSSRVAPPGSVLVGTRVGIGKVAVAPFDIAINQDLTALIPDGDVTDAHFLRFSLMSPGLQREFSRGKRGSTIKGVPRNDLLSFKVPLPPLPAQRAIARLLRSVERAMEQSEQVIAATRELMRSVAQHLFRYGPITVTDAESVDLVESEIGRIPSHWFVHRLGDLVDMKSGGTPDRGRPDYFGPGIAWVKSGELNDHVVTTTEESITEAGLAASNASVFGSGTLLVALYGATAGRVGVLGIDAATNQAVCALRPRNGLTTSFLFHALIQRRERLLTERHGGAQPNLSQRTLRLFPVPVPPVVEQQQIAETLDALKSKIEGEEASRHALGALFTALLRDLMAARIQVDALAGELA